MRALSAEEFATECAVSAVRDLLRYLGEDPRRDGLLETPARVVKALREMTAGYKMDPAQILSKTFAESSDQLILVRDIDFYSTCEHHLLPFYGTAHVAYLPGERVVGLSKIPRLVECFALRLQIQERLTAQIADALHEILGCRGVGVVIRAKHLCMACRGVRKDKASMVTSAMRGLMLTEASLKAEFLNLCREL